MTGETQWRIAELPEGSLSRTKHTWNGEPMKPARHLVLAVYPDGPMIYRYADDWQFAGDTWHQDTNAALEQIDFEFGVSDLKWKIVTEAEATGIMMRRRGD
jgi:hypothetical protein